jgi:hypothetical protein
MVGADIAIRRGIMPIVSNKGQGTAATNSNYTVESEKIGDSATSMMESMLVATASSNAMMDVLKEQKTLITVAIAGVVLAYQGISSLLSSTEQKRKKFEDELQTGLTTFCVHEKKEFSQLSAPEKAVVGFFRRLDAPDYSKLRAFAGIKCVVHEDKSKHYYGLPLYKVPPIDLPNASPHLLDQAMISINAFFGSKSIHADEKIADEFRTDYWVVAPAKALIQGENYLNNRRAPRIILNALFNILWNLLHPVDCESGFSLSAVDSMQVCAQFSRFINEYMADRTEAGPHKIHSDNENDLVRMIQHIEMRAEQLSEGMDDENRRTFKLKDLPNIARQTLRELDKSLLRLLFRKTDPMTKTMNPDPLAATDIADYISVFNMLLGKDASFLKLFDTERKRIPRVFLENTFINTECTTVIDALIIFYHLTSEQRQQFIVSIRELPQATEQSKLLARELDLFANCYIKPLETTLATKFGHVGPKERSRLLARIATPLCTIVAADFRIRVDTRTSLKRIKETRAPSGVSPFLSGGEQIQLINDAAQEYAIDQAESSAPSISFEGYLNYRWLISPFLDLTPQAAKAIDSLPGKQYRMTQTTELLDYISELTLNYRTFLQYKSFQAFLKDCLQQIGEEYKQFATEAAQMEQQLSVDGRLDRTAKAVLLNMVTKLTVNLKVVKRVNDDLSHIVSSPDFTELRKQELEKTIKRIENKFMQLFGRPPVSFTNACQNILVSSESFTTRSIQCARAEELYARILQFFSETQKTLASHSPDLPSAPHFLSAGKPEKIPKYQKMIQHAITYINQLQADKIYTLDATSILNQLGMITEDGMQKRRFEDMDKSSFCKVILGGLNTFLQVRVNQENASPTTAPAVPSDQSPIRERSISFFPHSRRGYASKRRSSLIASPETTSAIGSHEEPNAVFNRLKRELIEKLQQYIAVKEQERPTNWVMRILHIFKNWFGLLSNYIRNRLLDTKIRVAQKVLHGLETMSEIGAPLTDNKLILSPNEMRTLSHGTLGRKTLYFRENAFWQASTEVDENGLHLESHAPVRRAR